MTYCLSNVIYNNGTVRIPIVHGGKRLVSLLASGIPDLKLDCRSFVEGNGLCQEGGADGGFAVGVELVL